MAVQHSGESTGFLRDLKVTPTRLAVCVEEKTLTKALVARQNFPNPA